MKRDIEWKEKLGGGIKRTVRWKFPGGGRLKWQFKRSDEARWDYDTLPSAEDWENIENKVAAMLNRRRATYDDLNIVKQNRRKYEQKG